MQGSYSATYSTGCDKPVCTRATLGRQHYITTSKEYLTNSHILSIYFELAFLQLHLVNFFCKLIIIWMNYERNKKGARFFETQCSIATRPEVELTIVWSEVYKRVLTVAPPSQMMCVFFLCTAGTRGSVCLTGCVSVSRARRTQTVVAATICATGRRTSASTAGTARRVRPSATAASGTRTARDSGRRQSTAADRSSAASASVKSGVDVVCLSVCRSGPVVSVAAAAAACWVLKPTTVDKSAGKCRVLKTKFHLLRFTVDLLYNVLYDESTTNPKFIQQI